MSKPAGLPFVNFSYDTRPLSLVLASLIAALSIAALVTAVALIYDSFSQHLERDRAAVRTREITEQLSRLRSSRTSNEPDAGAIRTLRQKITSLNALDFGGAPSVPRVFSVLEELLPPAVALRALDYDRNRGALELVAVSESSEELTTFFDLASRSPFLKSVRLVDKKQAGSGENAQPLFQVRLSITLSPAEPRA
jgi:Tfp pilus assembly protein PilN